MTTMPRIRHGAGQPYVGPLPVIARDILSMLDDGEWHPVGWWNGKTLRRLEASALIHVAGDELGKLIAIATDAGLAATGQLGVPA